jgi:hypothetical protein
MEYRISIFVLSAVWLVLPSAVSAATVSASLKPAFQADLTNSLKLQAGFGNPTFTRTTIATVQDWEGLIRNVLSGEARFTGARRVRNFIAQSQNLNTSWIATTGGGTVTVNSNNSVTIATSASGQTPNLHLFSVNYGAFTGQTLVFTITVSAVSGSNPMGAPNIVEFTTGNSMTVTGLSGSAITGPGRYSFSTTNTSGTGTLDLYLGVRGGTSSGAGSITITNVQLEDVTGQSNQNPSEYVSCGVLPASYHGAGVDCVKYFNTLNGNTVASNVVGEASGAKITSAVSGASSATTDATGPFGYLAEGARTNLALQSEDLATTPWSLANGAATVSANAAVAPSGATTADKLIPNTNNIWHYISLPTTVVTATVYTYSVYVKAAGYNYVLINSPVGNSLGGNSGPIINLSNGTKAGYYVYDNPTTISSVGNGWYRVSIQITTSDTILQMDHNVLPTSSVATYNGDGTSGVYVWGAQLEAASFASSYIPTTTGSVPRTADALSYQASRNVSNSVGTVFVEFVGSGSSSYNYARVVGTSTGGDGTAPIFTHNGGATASAYDGTNQVDSPGSQTAGTLVRAAASWGGSTLTAARGGGVTSGTFDGVMTFGAITPGAGSTQLFGTIRNLKIWPKVLTNAQMKTMTATSNATARAAVPQATAKSTSGTGLVGWWKFDEGTGTRAGDSSGRGNTGTLVGSPTWTTGKLGKALSFNGSSQYININTQTYSLGGGTVALWFKKTGDGTGGNTLTGSYSGSGNGRAPTFGFSGSQLVWEFGSLVSQLAGITVDNEVWHHAVMTYDSAFNVVVYFDGVQVSSGSSVNPASFYSQVHFGHYGNFGGNYFQGVIDDARIYNRALSAAEVAALYKSTAVVVNASTNTAGGSLTSGLVGLWSFDGKDVNWATGTAFDRSGAGNNGSLISMSTTSSPTIGKIGQALKFNGSTTYVDLGDVSTLSFERTNSFSGSAWFKSSNITGGSWFSKMLTANGYDLGYFTDSTHMHVFLSNTWPTNGLRAVAVFSSSVADNKWHHIVTTYNGSSQNTGVKIYLDGILATMSYVQENSLTGSILQSVGARIGGRQSGGVPYTQFNGQLDDVRIYNRALSATEVKSLYNLGR